MKHADCILVLGHGRIIQRGIHDDLLAQVGLYRQIYALQLRDQVEFALTEQVGDGQLTATCSVTDCTAV